MSKMLIVTEKPSVARDIVAALGGFSSVKDEYWESDQFVCTFAVGHVLELLEPEEVDPIYKRWTLDSLPIIPLSFNLKPKPGLNERLRVIKKLMHRPEVDVLINACDAGREGELIFRELIKYFGPDKPIQRLWLQSMTAEAIRKGFQSLQDGRKFEKLGAAAECRSLADWLIGMNATRALTVRLRNKNQRVWSAGRVQTPTLALLVEREHEILAHLPEPFWRVAAEFSAAGHSYSGTWCDPSFHEDETKTQRKADRIFEEARARAIVEAVTGKTGLASEVRKPTREGAPLPFDLTSLQRTANSRFGWSAKRTLAAAQRCYEMHKMLTYPRTDSRYLPNDYVGEVDRVVQALAAGSAFAPAARYLLQHGRQNDQRIFDDRKVSDHFAIIPTGHVRRLEGDDARVFDLACRQFLAAFHPPAFWEQVERQTVVGGHHFQSRARWLREPGWRAVFEQDAGEEESQALPPLPAQPGGTPAQILGAQVLAEETKPPPRITEARLLSLMENAGKQIEDEELAAALREKGLGTPATRADIIENLKDKEYVDRNLRPTVKGMRLIDLLRRVHADRITSAELTGELELHLGEVEQGRRAPERFMGEIIDYAKEIVQTARSFEFADIYPDVDPLGPCPLCGQPVYERSWLYRCKEAPDGEDDCPLRIWKDKSGRYIDRPTAARLLNDRQTGILDGFRDRRGRTYKGELILDGNGQVVLRPLAGSEEAAGDEAPVFQVNPEPLGPCPIHTENCQVIETTTEFICEHRKRQVESGTPKPVGPVLPRLVCKREMTRQEAIAYFQEGETPLIEDFISKYGRPFRAKLKMKADGTRQFEFPPRGEGAPSRGRRASGAQGGRGASRKKTARSQTPGKSTKSPKKSTKKPTKKAAARKPSRSA